MSWDGLTPPYRTIVADPPWPIYKAGAVGPKADPSTRYSTLSVSDIAALPVESLAGPDAHLWLWALSGGLAEGCEVVRAWGFRHITTVTWCKRQPGVGAYLRSNTEHALFATRGKPMTPKDKPISTWYVWPRGAHSVKPAAFFDLVERVSPPPYVDLFNRQQRIGWDSWGWGYEEVGA